MSKLEKYLKRNNINFEVKKAHNNDGYILFFKVKDINTKIRSYIDKNYKNWSYCCNYEEIRIDL